jgi:hypothetical protein
MPNLVKCLRDVKEGYRAVLSVIDGVVNSTDETMSLFNCGVLRSEAELMGGSSVPCSTSGRSRLRRSFSKTLDATGKRLIGR